MTKRASIVAFYILVSLFGISALWLTACETVRDRAGAGTSALIDCEAPNLRAAVAELVPIFKLAVLKLIGSDTKVDTDKLRAACAQLVGDLPRCAMVSAIAILTAPAPAGGQTVIAGPLAVPDPGALRLAFEAARQDWGGSIYHTSAGTL